MANYLGQSMSAGNKVESSCTASMKGELPSQNRLTYVQVFSSEQTAENYV